MPFVNCVLLFQYSGHCNSGCRFNNNSDTTNTSQRHMAVCYVLYVTALAVGAWALGIAGSDVERLLEDTLDLHVEPLTDYHNTSSTSGIFVVYSIRCALCRLDHQCTITGISSTEKVAGGHCVAKKNMVSEAKSYLWGLRQLL